MGGCQKFHKIIWKTEVKVTDLQPETLQLNKDFQIFQNTLTVENFGVTGTFPCTK